MPRRNISHTLNTSAKIPCTISSSALVELGSLVYDSENLKFKFEKKLLLSVLLQTYFKIGLLFTNYLKLDIFKSYYMPPPWLLKKKKKSNISS